MNGACYLTDGEIFLESKKETLLPLSEIGMKHCVHVCMCVCVWVGFLRYVISFKVEFKIFDINEISLFNHSRHKYNSP
jgi:hypothetical protein